MPTSARRPDRTLISILAVIAAIVVVAVVVVFTRGAPAVVDPATPEGVVQAYTRAVMAGDRTTALEFLSWDIRDNCDRAGPNFFEDLRMTVVSTTTTNDTSVVQVTISHGTGGGLFGDSSYTSNESFTLINGIDGWRIEYTPWEFVLCFNQGNRS